MHDCGAANERTEKADHEIDRVIRGKNAEVTEPGRERIERSERDALLEIILVRHHAAFGNATGAGGVDDRGDIFARARHERRFDA